MAETDIEWSEEAAASLEGIFDYIAEDNPSAALRTVSGITNKIEMLKRFPELGPSVPGHEGVRSLLFGHYRTFYRYENGIVKIIDVFHGAKDIDRLLRGR